MNEFKEIKPVFSKEKKLEFIKNLIVRKTVGKVQSYLLRYIFVKIEGVKAPDPDELLQLVKDILESTTENNAIREMEIQDYKDS